MADPLSITASVIAVLGAADDFKNKLHKIKNLVHAPKKLLALINEVSDLTLVLGDIESLVKLITERRKSHGEALQHMETLVKRAKDRLLELDQLIHYHLLKPDSTPGKIKFSRREWATAKHTIEDFRRSLRDMRLDLVTQMLMLNSSYQSRIGLVIDDIHFISSQLQQNQIPANLLYNIANSQGETYRLIQTGLSPPPTRQPRSTGGGSETISSPVIRVTGHPIPYHGACFNHCRCVCHNPPYFRTPQVATRALGTLFIQYSGSPLGATTRCTNARCQVQYKLKAQVCYYFPAWLLSRVMAIQFMLTLFNEPVVSLTVRAVVPGSVDIFRFTLSGDVNGLQRLFGSRSASPNDVSVTDGETALQIAITRGEIQACEVLISAGADLNYRAPNSSSPLDFAGEMILCGTEDPTLLENLRNLFPDNGYLENRGFSKLHKIVLGILHCDLNLELAKADINVDVLDGMGRPALSWAARRGDVSAVGTLIKVEANLNIRDDLGKSPLLWALQAPTLACANLLLQHGADANIMNKTGQDALYYASFFHDDVEIIQRILATGADVNTVTGQGEGALVMATNRGHLKSAKALLDGGADINACDAEGDSALMNALVDCKNEAAAFLLKRGARYTSTNVYGESILHSTAKVYNSLETLDILEDAIIKGIDPDAVNKDGKTALQLAQQSRSKPEGFVERFAALLAGIRERNKAESNRINESRHNIDINASVLPPREVPDRHLAAQLRFPRLQGFWKSVTKISVHSTKPAFWLYLLLGLGWIGFFGLLLRPNGTDTRFLQSLRSSKADDNTLTKAEVLPHKLVLPRPIPGPVITTTQPTETYLQRSGDDTRQRDEE